MNGAVVVDDGIGGKGFEHAVDVELRVGADVVGDGCG
jgi:hypothetical protein